MKEVMRPEMMKINSLLGETDAVYHEAAVKLGISDSVMVILYLLSANGGVCAVSEFGKSGLGKQTANSALRKLESENAVVLEAAGGLRKNVRLTEKGKKLAKKTVLKIIAIENEIFDSWNEDDINKYIELNQKYLDQLREKVKKLEGEKEK